MSDEASQDGPSKRGRIALGIGVIALAAGAGVGVNVLTSDKDSDDSAATQDAAQPQQLGAFQRPTSGTITEIGDGTLKVKTRDNDTVDVKKGDDTTVTEVKEGSVDDLKVGDRVQVMGDTIVVGDEGFGGSVPPDMPEGGPQGTPPGQGQGPEQGQGQGQRQDQGQPPGDRTFGTIKAVDDDTFTVEIQGGDTTTVTLDDDTTIQVVEEIEWSDLKVGDQVMVRGTNIRRGDLGELGEPGAQP